MEIEVNKQPKRFDCEGMPLASVISACGFPDKGIAAALNNKVVRRAEWNDTVVVNGDCLTVVRAVCGG